MQTLPTGDSRWQLYRLLSDPTRLRLLALAAEEELSVGELAELLSESQPNVSRHAAPLRQAGLLADRKQGTRTLVRLDDTAALDPVVADALASGRTLCTEDGSLARVGDVVAQRDDKTREFFARPGQATIEFAPELPAVLSAFAPLLAHRDLAVDAGTGEGVLLDLLAPLFRRVVAIDRSEAQLDRAQARVAARGYDNVDLIEDTLGGASARKAVGAGADLVVAARVLHHAPRPKAALSDLARLARPGGRVLVIDYARHDDERLSEAQADVWLGFAKDELSGFARAAGLVDVVLEDIPRRLVRSGPDAHVGWISLLGTRRAEPGAKKTNGKTKKEQEQS